MQEELLGGLRVWVTASRAPQTKSPRLVVVLLHGFGAPGDDLVALSHGLAVPPGTVFAFPEAPVSLAGVLPAMLLREARAWWLLDLDSQEAALRAGRFEVLTASNPPGLETARNAVVSMLDELQRSHEVSPERIVLGGFSQGAIVACDVALHDTRPLAGLVLMSGTLMAQDAWVAGMPSRIGLRVLQSHGSDDTLMPPALSERLRDLFVAAGLSVDWVPFRGGHSVPQAVLTRLEAFLAHLAPEGS
ncbi:MAG: phospholipase [Polyangiaceae bacterium]|nr:phospholipase [Polyangiaceae bacterium]